MAESLVRGFNRIFNTPTLSLLRTYFISNPSSNYPYLGGNGWSLSTNLLVPCRYKTCGPLNSGNSTGRRVENGELYGPLKIGNTSKKLKYKRKYPNSLPTTTKTSKGIKTIYATPVANNITSVNGSFLSSINNITKPGKSSQKHSAAIIGLQNRDKPRKTSKVKNESFDKLVSTSIDALKTDKRENYLIKKNIFNTREKSGPTSFIAVSNDTKPEPKEQWSIVSKKSGKLSQKDSDASENRKKSQTRYQNNERDEGVNCIEKKYNVEKKSKKNIVLPLSSHSGTKSQSCLNCSANKETLPQIKENSSEPSGGFILVDDGSKKTPKLNKKARQNETASNEEFNKNLDALIDGLHVDRWETMVQKSLVETSKKSPSTSFVLVEDESKKKVSDDLFLDPRDQMETYVFEHNSQPCQNGLSSKNVSGVPNNTAKLSSQDVIGELKPDLSRKTVLPLNTSTTPVLSSQGINNYKSKSQPMLTVQPNENINGKQSQKCKENMDDVKKISCEQKNNISNSSIEPPIDFYNKSIWSKELLAAVERTKKPPTSELRDQKISSQKGSEIWASPSGMLDLKRNKSGKKTKDDNIFSGGSVGQRSGNTSIPKTKPSRYLLTNFEKDANELERCENGTFSAKEKLQDHLKSEFRQNFLDMQKERLNKKIFNSKPDRSTLVYTPNSMTKWIGDMEENENNRLIKLQKKQKNKIKETAQPKHKKKNRTNIPTTSDSIINACFEHQIRDKTSSITKSSNQVLSRLDNEVKGNGKDCGNMEKETYYVLSDDKLENYGNEKNGRYDKEPIKKQTQTVNQKTSGLFPMLQKMDGFMTMALTPVNDSSSCQKSEFQAMPKKMTEQQQSEMLKQNDELFEKNSLLRNMLAVRRYHDRLQREKEEKKKKKKRTKRNAYSNRERQQRTPLRSSKTN